MELRTKKVSQQLLTTSVLVVESEDPRVDSSVEIESSPTKVFEVGSKPGVTVGGCLGYNLAGGPPFKVYNFSSSGFNAECQAG